MSENKPSILITGANGFVGSRLCRTFLEKDFDVIAGVRKTANLNQLESLDIQYRYGDVNKPDTLKDMVIDIDYIIHNAGIVKAKKKQSFFDVNEQGTLSLFNAIANHNPEVKKVIYISSLAAAGPSTGNKPIAEDDPPHPITTYGQSKLAGEKVALSFSNNFPVISIRPPGVYGPRDKEVMAFFQLVYNRIKPFIGNTNRRLQLVHVDDLCRGIYLALTGETKSSEIYFIAENKSYSMKELIILLQKGCGKKGIPLVLPASVFRMIAYFSEILFKIINVTPMLTREKANELLASWEISTSKAKTEFGFESEISFEQGAKETYQWYLKEGWL
ncbi:MAG: NAD-dependent epimerase/dehydratase family protein [Candidatus Zixiibacteriota bacterium]